MQYRITSGTAALTLALTLAGAAGFDNLSVDGAFLVYELPAGIDGAKDAVTAIGDALSTLRDEAAEAGDSYDAHTTLINTTMALLRDIDRDFTVKAPVSEATPATQESHPTTADDSSISLSSKQSSDETQETVNEAQFEKDSTERTARNGRK